MKHLIITLFIFTTPVFAFATDWIMLPEMDNPYLGLYNTVSSTEYISLYNKVVKLEQKYTAAHTNEQSLKNKLLGAATIAATGIGGMMTASAIAEQKADADAEHKMAAHLATIHCSYGDTKNIKYGTKNIELPGGNELINMYAEYINLANDLKKRKAALGIRPGIESQPILESATSGLYDDIATGKTSGTYASLARALSNPTGPDAATWATQKSNTSNKIQTGIAIGGTGAVGGAIGNALINHNTTKK